MTIDEAYQDTVEMIVEADKLERRTDNLIRSFERLFARGRTPEEEHGIVEVGRRLVERLGNLLNSHSA